MARPCRIEYEGALYDIILVSEIIVYLMYWQVITGFERRGF